MKRFKHILAVVSRSISPDSNPALRKAADLAKVNQAKLVLMDVIDVPEYDFRDLDGILSPEDMFSYQADKSMQMLQPYMDGLRSEGVDVECKIVKGKDFIEIIREVVLGHHDLLIKLANDTANSFDSSDFHLMRKCPKPVWLVKSEMHQDSRRLVMSIDLALERHAEGREMNRLIMDLGTSMAQNTNAELHLLSCWSLYGESELRHSGFLRISEERLEAILKQEERLNREKLAGLCRAYDHEGITTHLIKGDPKEHISAFINSHDIDVAIMGTVGRSGIQGFLIGNTAETILQQIDSSVITVKPSGFKSPIR